MSSANWDHAIQYLPSSGMDSKLCAGDPVTCSYGEFCNCDEEFGEYELPEIYTPCINPIAQSFDEGLIRYLNPESMEIEEIQKRLSKFVVFPENINLVDFIFPWLIHETENNSDNR